MYCNGATPNPYDVARDRGIKTYERRGGSYSQLAALFRLTPRLRGGDIVVLDNLPAHKAPEIRFFAAQRRTTLKHLPPGPHDSNPIEPAWSLVKRRIRDHERRPCRVRHLQWVPGLNVRE
jgi:transposase